MNQSQVSAFPAGGCGGIHTWILVLTTVSFSDSHFACCQYQEILLNLGQKLHKQSHLYLNIVQHKTGTLVISV